MVHIHTYILNKLFMGLDLILFSCYGYLLLQLLPN